MIPVLSLEAVSITKAILGQAAGAMGVMQDVGRGIASIFLLFVIFHCVSSMLDGGKFQIKMLVPLLLYILVCNFSLVSSPVVSFTTAIQESCSNVAGNYQARVLNEMTHGAVTDGNCSLWDAFQIGAEQEFADNEQRKMEEKMNDLSEMSIEETVDGEGNRKWNIASLGQNIKSTLEQWWENIKQGFVDSIVTPISSGLNHVYLKGKWGLLGLVAVIFSWICDLLGLAVACLGGVMTGIIVAFGPVTWAFAMIPGNTRSITSWFIRLCQYALYSPLVALVQSFVITCLFKLGTASGGESITMLMGIILADIAALASIPSIASMIIEGASGAVSLSQGLQTAGAALGAGTSAVMSPFTGAYGAAKEWTNFKNMVVGGGESSRDERMQKALDAIATKVNPDYSPDGGDPSGQNNH